MVCHEWREATECYRGRKGVCTRGILRNCAHYGYLNLFHWALENGARWEIRVAIKAIRGNQLSILKWLYTTSKVPKWEETYIEEVARYGRAEIFEWMMTVNHYDYHVITICSAIASGDLRTVQLSLRYISTYQLSDKKAISTLAQALTSGETTMEIMNEILTSDKISVKGRLKIDNILRTIPKDDQQLDEKN
jgi:hypothetical protein